MKNVPWWVVALIAAFTCLIPGAIAALLVLPGEGGGLDRTPAAGSSVSPPTTSQATEVDVTARFLNYILRDVEEPPDWIEAIDRVYWSDSRQVRAETSLSPDTPRDDLDLRALCGLLSSYVLYGNNMEFTGVTILADDGSELLRREDQDVRC